MLVTADVPPTFGRVCYLDKLKKSPTVECYVSKIAYRFRIPDKSTLKISIGDWVKISGQTRLGNTRNKKTGLIDGVSTYYHDPYDRSSRSNWIFLELVNPICVLTGPLYLSSALINATKKGQAHIDDWSKTQDKDTILSTIDSFQKALDALHKTFYQIIRDEEEKNAKPIRFPKISFVDL
jgi:hypothetical protein